MHGRRFDRILTGTALALVLGLADGDPPPLRPAADQQAIEALVPMPEPANLPPPTAADVARRRPETTGSTAIDPARPARSAAADLQGRRARRLRPPTPRPPPAAGTCSGCGARASSRASGSPSSTPISRFVTRCASSSAAARLARIVDRKADRTAVEAFYSSRDYAPIWVGTDGATERAQAGDHASAQRRCRRHGSGRLSGPVDPGRRRARRAGGRRDAAHRVRARLRTPRPDRPRALFARQRGHLLRADRARAARRAEQARRGQERRRGARQLSAAACRPTRRCARSSPKRAAARAARVRRRSRAGRCSNSRPTSAPSRPS